MSKSKFDRYLATQFHICNLKETGKVVASKASKCLSDPHSSENDKSIAASDLTQPKRKGIEKLKAIAKRCRSQSG